MYFKISIVLLLVSVVILWYLRFQQTSLIPPIVDRPIRIVGVIENEPKPFYDNRTFQIDGLSITGKSANRLTYGDYVQVDGVLTTEGAVKQARVTVIEKNRGNKFMGQLSVLRKSLLPVSRQFLPPREAALINGLVLGEKSQGDKAYTEALRKTGTLHIIVVSGANLTMVAGFILQLRGILGLKLAITCSIVVVWLYALLTGAQPPVIRAAIMVSLTFLAQLAGRQQWQLYSLFFAATCMLVIKPQLISEISFQLSFAATLGIILFSQRFYVYFADVKFSFGKQLRHLPFSVAENLSTTLAAQLLVVPLILYHFHEISLLSPLVNVLVLPVVFYLTLLGVLLLFVGYFSSFLGTAVSWLILLPASYFSNVILMFARIPFVSTQLLGFNSFFVGSYYLYIVLAHIVLNKAAKPRQEIAQFATIDA